MKYCITVKKTKLTKIIHHKKMDFYFHRIDPNEIMQYKIYHAISIKLLLSFINLVNGPALKTQ